MRQRRRVSNRAPIWAWTLVVGLALTLGLIQSALAAADTDTQPPSVPSNVTAAVSPTGIVMSWDPSSDDVGVTGYLVHRDYRYLAWVPAGTRYSDNSVVSGTTYRYQVRAKDAAGNTSQPSPRVKIDYLIQPDITPPTIPEGVTGAQVGSSFVLSWSPSADNVAIKGYLVHRDSIYLGFVPVGTSYTDLTAVPGPTYDYVIRAQDTANNNSAPSAPVALTLTGFPPDPPLTGLNGLIVTAWGRDLIADGTPMRPYGSISAAAAAAPNGGAIYVSNGIFRDSVDLEAKSLSVRAVPGAAPVLSGADLVTGWTALDRLWFAPGPDHDDAGWPTGMTSSPQSALVDLVVVNGTQLTQVTSRGAVTPTSFWVDGAHQVWIGVDPAANTVEIGARNRAIFARDAVGFEVQGLTVRHYVGGPGDRGAIEVWGTGTVVRDVITHDNANAGVRLLGADPLVEGLTATRNGRIGLTMHNVDDGVVRDSSIVDNNTELFNPFGAAGGIKVTAARDVTVQNSVVDDNAGHGIWFDLSSIGIQIESNLVRHNTEAAIHVEVSAQATVHANTVSDNGRGIYIVESNDVVVSSNVLRDNARSILILDSYRAGDGCVDREIGAVFTPPIDARHGCQWPVVKWNVDNVDIFGNSITSGDPASPNRAMIEINHVAHPSRDIGGEDRRTSAEVMGVTIGTNTFERVSLNLPKWVVAWSQWPSHMAVYTELSPFIAATGQAVGSTYVAP